MLFVVVCTLGTRQEGFLENARIPRLVECRNSDLLVRILFDDAERVLVCVERGHEDERDIDAAGGVEVLDLSNSQVEESHIILDLECTFGTGHTWESGGDQDDRREPGRELTHGGAETTIDLEDCKLVEVGLIFGCNQRVVGDDFVLCRGFDAIPVTESP